MSVSHAIVSVRGSAARAPCAPATPIRAAPDTAAFRTSRRFAFTISGNSALGRFTPLSYQPCSIIVNHGSRKWNSLRMSTLANAVAVLRLFASDRVELTVTDVARALDMPKSSVSRLLKSMRDAGLLTGAGAGAAPRYRLGNL